MSFETVFCPILEVQIPDTESKPYCLCQQYGLLAESTTAGRSMTGEMGLLGTYPGGQVSD